MKVTIYTFYTNGIPIDPQVLAVYNSLSRAQKARYNTLTTDRERSIFLYVIAEEKKKLVCLLRWYIYICL